LFDLDRTIAYYQGGKQGIKTIGDPIPEMVELIRELIQKGETVKIFTARVSHDPSGAQRTMVEDWTEQHIGTRLEVTCCKDYTVTRIYDDLAVSVIPNSGIVVDIDDYKSVMLGLPLETTHSC